MSCFGQRSRGEQNKGDEQHERDHDAREIERRSPCESVIQMLLSESRCREQ
ncbi:MAG TPA: hypothetical protein VKH44_11035 [Pirellulaceae bacterium]|nr:hypothetical protein [Pirellulaceae bacterium]